MDALILANAIITCYPFCMDQYMQAFTKGLFFFHPYRYSSIPVIGQKNSL